MMTCQNCGSNDIIAIQDQNYCINCGQLVGGIGNVKKIKNILSSPPKTVGVAAPKPIEPQVVTEKKMVQPDLAPIGDITPIKPNKSGEFTRQPLLDLRKTIKPSSDNQESTAKPHAWKLVLKLAISIAAPFSGLLALALFFKVDADLILYATIGGGVIAGLSVMILNSALLYGGSKAQDGRMVVESKWWEKAKSRFTEILLLNLLAVIGLLVLTLAAYGFYAMAQLIPSHTPQLQAAMLLISNVFICWLLLGLLCIRRLMVAIITIGGQPPAEAFRMAWWMYKDYGGHLILSIAETALIKGVTIVAAVVICFGAYTLAQANSDYEPVAYGLAVLLSILIWLMIFLRFEITIWLSRYRWIAGKQTAQIKSQLLAGSLGP